MQFPYQSQLVNTSQNTISATALVSSVVNAIRAGIVIPYGDFGGPNVFYFSAPNNGLGNIIYTVFDRETTLGLASYTVRYGAATTIKNIVFDQYPRGPIDLQMLILPKMPVPSPLPPGTIVPQ